ncbi:MAG: efflux RND transporter periplasmic adaptor subunit [Thermoanaerobaculia bacterium]|nr:efflux RND transporter periplasmic adaptor subunit [Thermoanaerobaculia bacterium]
MSPLAAQAAPVSGEYASHLMVEQDVQVTARMTGIIVTIHVERGVAVAKNQPLASLDARELELNIREARKEMELRRAEWERAKALAAGNILSRAELDERQARYEVALARYDKTKELRDRAIVRAPFAGVVSDRYARIGQKVIEDENIPLFKVTASEPLLARVYLPEDQLMKVKVGDPVEILPVRFPAAKATGTVQFISPTVDAGSCTFQVLIRVKRGNASVLRPGVAVRVRFSPDARS